jgi:hypothetical protein
MEGEKTGLGYIEETGCSGVDEEWQKAQKRGSREYADQSGRFFG